MHRLYQWATNHPICCITSGWDRYDYGVIFSDEVIEGLNSVRVEEGRESWIADGQLRRLEGVRYFSEFDSFRDFKPEERRMTAQPYSSQTLPLQHPLLLTLESVSVT